MTHRTVPDPSSLAAAALSATLATAAIAIVAAFAALLTDSACAQDAATPAAVVALSIVQERT